MGYAEFRSEDDTETFLRNMDEKMYEKKRKYHSLNQAEHLKKSNRKFNAFLIDFKKRHDIIIIDYE